MYQQKSRPDRRGVRRWHVMWPATLSIEGRTYPCTILDLSQHGARIEAHGVQFGPSLATLHSDLFGPLECRIQWARGFGAGVRFQAAPADVLRVLQPIVPGLGRREKVAVPQPEVHRSFGRIVRDKARQIVRGAV
jgi:hypothetical protein